MADDLTVVGVLRSHLTALLDVLDHVEGHLVAEDLAQDYKNMGAAPRRSRLTSAVIAQKERIGGYLNGPEESEIPSS